MKYPISLSNLLILSILIAACHTTKKASSLSMVNDIWVLQSLNGFPLEVDSFDKEKPRLEIKTIDKTYFGYSGCNNLNGGLDITETTITFKPGPMTRKACLEQNIEPAFLKALFAVQIYSVTVGKLTLYTKEGKTLAQFRKVD